MEPSHTLHATAARRARVVAELLAQVGDVHVDRALAHHRVAAARLAEERVARHHAPGPPRERHEEVELHPRELDALPRHARLAAREVDDDGARAELGGGAAGLRAAEDGAEAREELPGGDGLREVVVGAELEAHHPVGLVAAGREHEDGDVAPRADAAAHLEAVEAGHHHVEEDGVVAAPLEHGEAAAPVGGVRRRDVVLREVGGDELGEAGVVVDVQHPDRHGGAEHIRSAGRRGRAARGVDADAGDVLFEGLVARPAVVRPGADGAPVAGDGAEGEEGDGEPATDHGVVSPAVVVG